LQALAMGWAVPSATPEIKQACAEALAGNRAGTIYLLEAHANGDIPADLVPLVGRLVRNSPFQDLRNRALIAFPAAGKLNPKKLPAVAELVKRTGNADRGKQVFAESLAGAAACMKCHMVRGTGGQIGPDLSMIGKKASRENLFESILLPSKAIADQYVQESVTTAAGLTVTGLVVADTAQGVTLRDANGKDTIIPKADVEGRKKLQVSIMPEDSVAALTEDELIDLVAYLQTLQTAALTPDSFRVVGPFPAKSMEAALDAEFGPEKGVTVSREPKTIRPDAKGYFDLAALHGKDAVNSASYMFAEIESPAEQDAEVLLGLDDGGRLWVNGKEVHASRDTKAAAPEQHKVPVKLAKGKNAVLLKVANGNNPHGFYFTLLSRDETKLAKP
jgi:putative heme-binding domain-containing protein